MEILLTEGSGLTSRQVAGALGAKGHEVGVLSSDPIGLARFTRAVGRWHSIVPFGTDPLGWLGTATHSYRAEGYDLLVPSQEQVAVLAARPQQLLEAEVVTVVPSFASLLAVQDKIAARSTLLALGVAQPESEVLASLEDLASWRHFPVYIKEPIGTATSGVHHLETPSDLHRLLRTGSLDAAFTEAGLLAQLPAAGPLAMVQTVFDQGHLVAFHANLRIRQGARGGASHKRSIHAPRAGRAHRGNPSRHCSRGRGECAGAVHLLPKSRRAVHRADRPEQQVTRSQHLRSLDAAADSSLEKRLAAGPVAYRRWAIEHRQQFNLIFFDQISGYAAPPDGPTVDAQADVLRPIATQYAEARGRTISDLLDDDEPLDDFLGWWGAFHGIVALEVNHHLDWREPEAAFLRHLRASIRDLISPDATTTSDRRGRA